MLLAEVWVYSSNGRFTRETLLCALVFQGEFVESDLEVNALLGVAQYWRWRCLPPASPGVVQVLGVVSVQDVTLYLQCYSLPFLTVLLTPIIRLVLAINNIYFYKPSNSTSS